ncbi:hypothetical protein Ahy_A06g026063 [Arachis hypogaea]|uniref:Uncharacterized protein n=1 Tax=Arachis hypogaea TaxID=3818 RepID=A0A445CJ97_ARAHY|nr:hypothetical protein Ahy_A06g026063 [Arachis hypogaea]
MQLRSERIIHMADVVSNVNGGSSTNDSIPVTVQSSNVTSRSKGLVSVNGVNNSQNPQQHYEFSCDYNVGSTSNASNSLAVFRQHVEESHHDLVNLLTQQMTTILNPMMANHKLKFECLTRQVERIARIVDYDEGERHDVRGNNERFENLFQNENNVLNRENPQIILCGQNADDVLARLRANYGFYMRRKLLNVHITDLAHLAKRVRQVELMKKEKEKYKNEQRLKNKPFTRKEKVAYVAIDSSEEEFDFEAEVDLDELKKSPPYSSLCNKNLKIGTYLCVLDAMLCLMLKLQQFLRKRG